MERLTFQDLLAVRDEFDAAVLATPGISKFCSSSEWGKSAFLGLNGFNPDTTETFIVREGDSWVVFVEKSPNVFYPFESAWMFQCPLLGPDAVSLFERAKAEFFTEPKAFVIGGLPKNGPLSKELAGIQSLRFEVFPATDCMIINLEGGVDDWLSRRSPKFRRTLRDAERNCVAAEVEIEVAAPDFDRLFAIQQQTAKWKNGSDIFHSEECLRFYRRMIEEGIGFHFQVATIDGKDAAFLLGAVFGNTFRGLQMSFDETHRALGLGNFLQITTLRHMAEAEKTTTYDLGMFSEYKSRWADETREFVGCLLVF